MNVATLAIPRTGTDNLMSKDALTKFRKKAKYVFEARYEPIWSAFESRGKTALWLDQNFKSKLPISKIGNVEVHQTSEETNPEKVIFMDHNSTRVIYEDAATLGEFEDDCKKVIKGLYALHGESVKVLRVGVRFQSIFEFSTLKSFDLVHSKTRSLFVNERMPLTVTVEDLQMVFKHSSGQMVIGALRDQEAWINQIFMKPTKNIPKCGLGLDVDSFITNLKKNNPEGLIQALLDVEEMTQAVEREVIGAFEKVE